MKKKGCHPPKVFVFDLKDEIFLSAFAKLNIIPTNEVKIVDVPWRILELCIGELKMGVGDHLLWLYMYRMKVWRVIL